MWFAIKWTQICFPSKYYEGKKKPIDTYTSDELGVDITPRIKQLKVTEPPKREKGIMVENIAELVHKLKHEAKVI